MITGLVIAKNEEEKINECLKSLNWVDELIVVDDSSIDKTAKIAKNCKAIVYKYTKHEDSYAKKRNFALSKAKGDWILYVDADERVTPELQKEIQNTLAHHAEPDSASSFSAYAIPRKNIIFGREFKHSGQRPDYVKRLFKKDNLKGWKGDLHEEPVLKEENLGHLKNSLIHLKPDDLSVMIDKTNWWSEIEAKLMYDLSHPPMNIPRFTTAILRETWKQFIIYKCFLDGIPGIIYGTYQVYSRFISYAKLWEMQIKK